MASIIKYIPLLTPALPEGDAIKIDQTLMDNRAYVATLLAVGTIALVGLALLNPPAAISGALSYVIPTDPLYKAVLGLVLFILFTKPIQNYIVALDSKITRQALDGRAVFNYMKAAKPSVVVMQWIASKPEAFELLKRQPEVLWNKPDENGTASHETDVIYTTKSEVDKLYDSKKKSRRLIHYVA